MGVKRKTFIKVFAVLGSLLLVAGLALFIAGMAGAGWDFSVLNTVRYTEKTYLAEGTVTSLRIEYSDAALLVGYSETAETVRIDYPVRLNERNEETAQIEILEENGTLTVIEHTEWEKNIFQWNLGNSPTVRVVLPAGEYALDLQTDNGAILVDAGGEAAFSELSLRSANGNIELKTSGAAIGGDAEFKTENGSISVANIDAEGALTLRSSNGEVRAENISATEIAARSSNGSLKLTEASAENALTAETDNGAIELCGTIAAKTLRGETTNGAIAMKDGLITVQEVSLSSVNGEIFMKNSCFSGTQSDYTVQVSAGTGNANVSDSAGGSKKMFLSTHTGSIRVFFEVS